MSKRLRQYIGIFAAIAAYYLVHEGAHLLYAVLTGTFRQICFMGIGMQIETDSERMTDAQLGMFCLVGPAAALCTGYLLTALSKRIGEQKSRMLRAVMYYITIALLLIDPLYLSVLCGLFGGGDMNGIALLLPEWGARGLAGLVLIANGFLFWKYVLPVYRKSFCGQVQG